MNIRFDQEFDGYPWPGPLGDLKARFGHQWVGPQGFLALLETQLGLGGPTNSQAVRAAALVPAVIATPGFWSKSALVDPLGAAKTLLHWRDLLWSAGWRGQGLTPRLNELGTVTRLVPPGPPDRLVAVAASAAKSSTDIEQVELLEDRDVLDPSWQSVLKNLEASGARIVAVKLQVAAAKGDVQAARGTKFEPAADGSLQLFRPLGPHAAAESVAAWLAASGNVDSTVIIGAEPILDAALRRHGLPTVGATPSYRDNSLLEILPLVIQLGWSPADPARALELLTLPNSPIRRGVRGRLVGALTQWPAVESDAWRLALKEGLAQIEDADDRDRLAGRLDVLLRPTVTGTRYPATELRRRASALIQWLQGRSTPEDSDQGDYESAIIQCTGFCKLLDLVGLPDLNRPQLQRLLEDATKDAPARPRYSAQAGFCSVASPGAVCGPVERVVWWNFSRDAAERPSSIPLTPVELKALSDANIILPDQTTVAMQINARWGRPLQSATSQLMLVCPKYGEQGEELHPHPLWDQIAANAGPTLAKELVVRTPLFVKPPKRKTFLPLEMPEAHRDWKVPKGLSIPARENESPSGAGVLVGCSFRWALTYAGKIGEGHRAELPSADRLVGSVAHEILGLVLQSKCADAESAEKEAERLFDTQGPRLAAIMFMPGSEKLKQQSRRATARAAKALVRHLQENNLDELVIEKTVSGIAFGSGFEGRLDLLVGPKKGVIDLKWSGEDYRRQELEAGAAYQLASYSHLIRGDGACPPVAYFIISTQRLLTTDPEFLKNVAPVSGADPQSVWTAFEKGYRAKLKQVQSGLLTAPGDLDEDGKLTPEKSGLVDGTLELEPPCRFCSFGLLCGHGLELDAVAAPALAAAGTAKEGT